MKSFPELKPKRDLSWDTRPQVKSPGVRDVSLFTCVQRANRNVPDEPQEVDPQKQARGRQW